MVNVTKTIVSGLKAATSIEVYYELIEHPYTLPCITYTMYDNAQTVHGETLAYSSVGYYIKVWGKDLSTVMPYIELVDNKMDDMGFSRVSYNELAINDAICIVTQYRGTGKEERN